MFISDHDMFTGVVKQQHETSRFDFEGFVRFKKAILEDPCHCYLKKLRMPLNLAAFQSDLSEF